MSLLSRIFKNSGENSLESDNLLFLSFLIWLISYNFKGYV